MVPHLDVIAIAMMLSGAVLKGVAVLWNRIANG
jgi:hypothetical protein